MASELPEAGAPPAESAATRARESEEPAPEGPEVVHEPLAPGGMPGSATHPSEARGLRGRLTRWIVDWLLQPIPGYERRSWNDPVALARHVRKGDVLLVEDTHGKGHRNRRLSAEPERWAFVRARDGN